MSTFYFFISTKKKLAFDLAPCWGILDTPLITNMQFYNVFILSNFIYRIKVSTNIDVISLLGIHKSECISGDKSDNREIVRHVTTGSQ